jgi:hypothetical protein
VSINQLINSAISEKVAALMTEGYLEERAGRATRDKFDAALAKVADIEPEDVDRLDADKAAGKALWGSRRSVSVRTGNDPDRDHSRLADHPTGPVCHGRSQSGSRCWTAGYFAG